MIEEAKFVLSCDEYKYEISEAMRDAAKKAKTGIGANLALLDAARRYETRVWCDIYNLGGSHGRIGNAYRHLADHVNFGNSLAVESNGKIWMRKSATKFERSKDNSQGDLVCSRLNCLES